ncbi:MAG: DUF3784 domain-containing protein [Muribaculaceae bacterium]|nr:DUF3784 domain-containing protein [Muribaculaceae bacterium]
MIIVLILNIILVVSAIVILLGKGDFLIAGYNTASEQEKRKVNVKRLRYVMAAILFASAILISLPFLCGSEDNVMAPLGSTLGIVIVTIIGVVLANTWCMKK